MQVKITFSSYANSILTLRRIQLSSGDNALLEPLLEAAKRYRFGDFDFDDTDDGFAIKIKPPFSPSWLLPKESQYFYYREGNFPVPPCFPIGQVYVFKDPIKISAAQVQNMKCSLSSFKAVKQSL